MHGIDEYERYLADSRVRYRESGAEFIYSLSYVKEFVFQIIGAAKALSVCEIGSQGGFFSQELHRLYREGVIERLTIVDPMPSALVNAMVDDHGCSVVKGLSLDVLETLAPHDLYIVDGDHNYHTVKHELLKIFKNRRAVAVMHDIAWPCGTRDMYYKPETVPTVARHPYTFDVVLDPADDGIAVSGETSGGNYAVALTDGGPLNGVFPALRDVAAELGLHMDGIAALLGVGVLRHADHPATQAIRDVFPSPEVDAVLWRLEENRISNWIAKQRAEDQLRSSEQRKKELEGFLDGGMSAATLCGLAIKWFKRALKGRV
jgi:hypothetical protein